MKITFKKGKRAGESQNFSVSSLFIGRGDDNDISLDNDSVSQSHAEIYLENKKWYIKDCKSSNGIKINGQKISNTTELHSHDLIYIGTEVLQVEFSEYNLKQSDNKTADSAIKIRGPREKKKIPQYREEIIEEPQTENLQNNNIKNTPTTVVDPNQAQKRLIRRMISQELANKRKRLRTASIFIAVIANILILLWWLSKKGYIDISKLN